MFTFCRASFLLSLCCSGGGFHLGIRFEDGGKQRCASAGRSAFLFCPCAISRVFIQLRHKPGVLSQGVQVVVLSIWVGLNNCFWGTLWNKPQTKAMMGFELRAGSLNSLPQGCEVFVST